MNSTLKYKIRLFLLEAVVLLHITPPSFGETIQAETDPGEGMIGQMPSSIASVSNYTGALNMTFPVSTPRGIGPSPHIVLNYNTSIIDEAFRSGAPSSAEQSGFLGAGWLLNLGTITEISHPDDGDPVPNDPPGTGDYWPSRRVMINFQGISDRLKSPGAGPWVPADPNRLWYTKKATYLKIRKIQEDLWEIYDQNGIRYVFTYYRHPSPHWTAKYSHYSLYAHVEHPVYGTPDKPEASRIYLLTRVTDVHGHFMEIEYHHYDNYNRDSTYWANVAHGFRKADYVNYYPKEIRYTHDTLGAPLRKVNFEYIDRDVPNEGVVNPYNKSLSAIVVKRLEKQVSRYEFAYTSSGRKNLLKEISIRGLGLSQKPMLRWQFIRTNDNDYDIKDDHYYREIINPWGGSQVITYEKFTAKSINGNHSEDWHYRVKQIVTKDGRANEYTTYYRYSPNARIKILESNPSELSYEGHDWTVIKGPDGNEVKTYFLNEYYKYNPEPTVFKETIGPTQIGYVSQMTGLSYKTEHYIGNEANNRLASVSESLIEKFSPPGAPDGVEFIFTQRSENTNYDITDTRAMLTTAMEFEYNQDLGQIKCTRDFGELKRKGDETTHFQIYAVHDDLNTSPYYMVRPLYDRTFLSIRNTFSSEWGDIPNRVFQYDNQPWLSLSLSGSKGLVNKEVLEVAQDKAKSEGTEVAVNVYYPDGSLRGLLEKEIVHNEWHLNYDTLDQTIDNDSQVTKFEYNLFGEITAVVNAEGHRTETHYDVYGRVEWTKDANNKETRYEYDDIGRIRKVFRPGLNSYSKTEYYDLSNFDNIAVTDQYIKVTTGFNEGTAQDPALWEKSYFDGLDRRYKVETRREDNKTAVGLTHFDNVGRIWKVSDSFFAGEPIIYTETQYDELSRVKKIYYGVKNGELPNDNIHRKKEFAYYIYSGWSGWPEDLMIPETGVSKDAVPFLVTSVMDENGRSCFKYLDSGGKTLANYNADVLPRSYNYFYYDILGRLLKTRIDSSGKDVVCQKEYNKFDQCIVLRDPDIGTWKYGYYPIGTLRYQDDNKTQRIVFYYDKLNRLVTKKYPDGSEVNIYYDQDGHGASIGFRTKMEDASGVTQWFYDDYGMGRKEKEVKTIDNETFTMDYRYDPLGNLTQITYPANQNGIRKSIEQIYDTGHNLYKIQRPDGSKIYVDSTLYNALGQMTYRKFANNGQEWRRYYNAVDNSSGSYFPGPQNSNFLADHEVVFDSAYLNKVRYNYGYDNVGNITMIRDTLVKGSIVYEQSKSFTYDGFYRLKTSTGPEGFWDYDNIGNLLVKNDWGDKQLFYDAARPHAVWKTASETLGERFFYYDENGNMTVAYGDGTSDGELISGEMRLSYNYDQRVTRIWKRDESGREIITLFTYDGGLNRVKKVVCSADNIVTTIYYMQNWFQREVKSFAPDLELISAWLSDPTPKFLQRDVFLNTTIKNKGGLSSGLFAIKIMTDGALVWSGQWSGLNAGQEVTLKIPWLPEKIGCRKIEVNVIPVANEYWDTNNSKSFYTLVDIDGNGNISIVDIMKVTTNWNTLEPTVDLNRDGKVDIVDILTVVSLWRVTCPQ